MLAAGWWRWWAAIPFAVWAAFVAWFFRDPERRPPEGDGLLVAPADGKILRADDERITIFMNVFNVHVCRAPDEAAVRRVVHREGRFLAAFKEEALTQNERVEIDLAGPAGVYRAVLVAGLIARRIVPWIREGADLARGERLGLIRFGSRVDLYLPPTARPDVTIGDRVVAGETVVARIDRTAATAAEASP